jgi:hypothetical protein
METSRPIPELKILKKASLWKSRQEEQMDLDKRGRDLLFSQYRPGW